jgi:hypothetical protein
MQRIASPSLSLAGLAAALSLALKLFALLCIPEPCGAPRASERPCQQAGEDLRFGLSSAVEHTSSACSGDGSPCAYGECFLRCEDDRRCPQRQVWREGSFTRP